MGVVNCHNMLMLLAVSKEFTEKERDVVIPLIMKGFQDTAREAGCLVTGGQTVLNPWCTVGKGTRTTNTPIRNIFGYNFLLKKIGDSLPENIK